MSRKTVTYVCHAACRSGAPLTLLNMLKHMRHVPWETRVLFLKGGSLFREFEKICPVRVIDGNQKTASRGVFSFLKGASDRNERAPDLYVQYSHSYDFLQRAEREKVPVISYVHEGPLALAQLNEATRTCFQSYPVQYLGVSEYVRASLKDMGIPDYAISVLPAGIDIPYWESAESGDGHRRALGIPQDALIIGAAGQLAAHKGVDLWLHMARVLVDLLPDRRCHFVWVGGVPDGSLLYANLMKMEAARLGIADRVHFVGEKADPRSWYAMFDVFTQPSRMESLSLVCVENAFLGKPVIAFHGSGGVQELAERGFVSLAKDLEPAAMAAEIVRCVQHKNIPADMTKAAREVIPRQYDVRMLAGRLEAEIGAILNASPVSR